MKTRLWLRPDILALAAATAILAFWWSVGAGRELWFDERFVQVVSRMKWPEMFDLLRYENNPPLFFFLANIWQRAVGSNEVALRILTLAPTIGLLAVIRSLANKLAGSHIAALSVILTSVSGMVVAQAGEFRMYPWLTLWAALALLLTWNFSERPSRLTLIALTLVNLFGIYTHYTYFFVLVFLAGWLFYTRWRTQWRQLVVSFGALAAAFLPWFWLSLMLKIQDLTTNVGIQRLAADRWQIFVLPFRFIIPPWFLDGTGWQLLRVVGSLVITLGLLAFIISAVRSFRERRNQMFIGLFILTTAALSAVTGLAVAKYAVALLPAVVIAISWGLFMLPLDKRARAIAVIALLSIAAAVAFKQVRQPFVTYAAAAKVVERSEQESDRILVYPFNDEIAVRPYYHGRLRVTGFLPIADPGRVTIRDVVSYNFRVTLDEKNVERLAEYIGDAQRVWFFFDVPPSRGYWRGDLIAAWFKLHGFTETRYTEIFRNVPPLLVRYDRVSP